MTLYHTTFATPAGDFSVAVNDDDAIVATAFGGDRALRARLKKCGQLRGVTLRADERRTGAARRQVREYFAGKRRAFDLPLAASGTEFQTRVWRELRRIPFGATTDYGSVARRLGSGPRAVGGANGANPICLIVPCHRVIGADGSLTGFAFGEGVKRRLLEHEGALA